MSFFKKKIYLFIYLFIICKYTIAAFRHQKRVSDLIMDGCEPPCICWDLNSGPLEEQSVLFFFLIFSFSIFFVYIPNDFHFPGSPLPICPINLLLSIHSPITSLLFSLSLYSPPMLDQFFPGSGTSLYFFMGVICYTICALGIQSFWAN